MPDPDQMMQQASEALARMDYLRCEELALAALEQARHRQDWDLYARILLPIQESRRQRRMIAADGGAKFFDGQTPQSPCCIIVTRPSTRDDAARLHAAAHASKLHQEVLFVDSERSAGKWRIQSFAGPIVSCVMDAPNAADADWFLDACEALGDAALGTVTAPAGDIRRVEQLERCLDVVTDHEIIHQRLWDAARAMYAPARR